MTFKANTSDNSTMIFQRLNGNNDVQRNKTITQNTTAPLQAKLEKIILAYVPFWYNDIIQNTKFDKCRQQNCRLTLDRKLHHSSSGVLMCERVVPMPMPPKLKEQIWIFHTDEAPFTNKLAASKTRVLRCI